MPDRDMERQMQEDYERRVEANIENINKEEMSRLEGELKELLKETSSLDEIMEMDLDSLDAQIKVADELIDKAMDNIGKRCQGFNI